LVRRFEVTDGKSEAEVADVAGKKHKEYERDRKVLIYIKKSVKNPPINE